MRDALATTIARTFVPHKYRRPLRGAYRRVTNWLRYRDQFYIAGLAIEVSTACNRRCPYCPVSLGPPKQRVVSDKVLDAFCRRLREMDWDGTVGLTFYNEPTLVKTLPSIVRRIKAAAPRCGVLMHTNGDHLTFELVGDLVVAGMVEIVVSRHPPFSDAWDTRVRMVMREFPKVVRMPGVASEGYGTRGGLIPADKLPTGNSMAGATSCRSPESVNVTVDGDVVLCCEDYHRKNVMGNILNQSIHEIYYGPRFAKIRSDLRAGKFNLPICKVCTAK